ncbi:addiction module antidote protein [Pseudomonas sp. MYb118]|uniref:addiction module antidote protein n=1 Tax=Pseudomonas sp. MYb118 TaxID=1848720 RepID=UPI0034CFE1F4
MTDTIFNPEDMPILNLDTSGTSHYEASSYLANPEVMAKYIAESMKAGDSMFIHAIGQVAKAKGVNNVALEAGLNRESLYKLLKGGAKTRFETIRKLMTALGLELTVRPLSTSALPSEKSYGDSEKPSGKPVASKPSTTKSDLRSAANKTKKVRTSSKETTTA